MTKKMKQLKLLGVVSAFAVFIAAASVVYGGLSWTGIDPIITLDNGDVVNVVLLIDCGDIELQEPVKVTVKVPHGLSATHIDETKDVCGSGMDTVTTVKNHGDDSIKAKAKSDGKILGGVIISVKGDEVAFCERNKAKKAARCAADYEG